MTRKTAIKVLLACSAYPAVIKAQDTAPAYSGISLTVPPPPKEISLYFPDSVERIVVHIAGQKFTLSAKEIAAALA